MSREPANPVGFTMRGDLPWCETCGKPVDRFEFKFGLREKPSRTFYVMLERDGSLTVTVACHGETWTAHRSRSGIWQIIS